MADDTPTEPVDAAEPDGAQAAVKPGPGFFVPRWLAVLVACVVLVGGGFGIGYAVGDNGDGRDDLTRLEDRLPGVLRDLDGRLPDLLRDFLERGGRGLDRLLPDAPREALGRGAAFLGVGIDDPADGVSGALVSSVVDGSPADDAGLQVGDVITAVDGDDVADPAGLVEAILDHEPGDEVTVRFTRDGETREVRVTLVRRADVNRPAAEPAASPAS